MKPLLAVCALALSIAAQARYLSYKHFTTAHGVPHSVVFRGFQDARGFIWFGTDAGLARFDGHHFKTYRTPKHDINPGVLSIEAGPGRNLFIASYRDGIYQVNIDNPDSLRPYPIVNAAMLPKRIIQLTWHEDRLWFIALGGQIGYIHQQVCHLQTFSAYAEKLRVIHGVLFACTRTGLFAWKHNTFKLITPENQPVYDIAAGSKGSLWIGTMGKIMRCSSKDTVIYPLAGTGEIRQLLCDPSGIPWFTDSKQGLYYLEKGNMVSLPDLFGIRHIICNELFRDRDGNTWTATYGDGIYCFYNRYISSSQKDNRLSDQFIKCIAEGTHGKIYVGTLTGAHVRTESLQFSAMPFGLLPNAPLRFIRDWNGKYVAGTYQQVVIADHAFRKQIRYNISGTAIYAGDPHTLYVGSYGSVYLLRPGHRVEKMLLLSESQLVNRIVKNSKGIYWLATDSGLAYTRDFKRYGYLYVHHGLLSNKINDLYTDHAGRLWIATGKGLQLWKNGRFIKALTAESGLSHSNCIALAPGRADELWIATAKGVNCLHGGRVYHIGTAQGLPADEVTSLLYASPGDLWVGTVNGISRIDLNEMGLHASSHKPAISEIRSTDALLSVHEDSVYQLAPFQRSFTVFITSFDYIHSNAVTYAYRLNQQPWQETQNAQIDFANISPGDYVLQIRAKNPLLGWSVPFSWHFTVNRPYWKTTWFRTCLVVLAALGAWLFLKKRIRQVQQREREKLDMYKNIQALKQHSLTSLLSPHFVFNALHSIQHFINRHDKRAANEYLADFARLVRMTMNDASQVFISLHDELEHLGLYLGLEKLRYGEKLRYSILADETIDPEETFLPSLLIQPYVENAIWHGLMNKKEGGQVNIIISRNDHYLNIVIEDDGIGMRKDTSSQSLSNETPRGTAIIRKRLELLGILAEKPVLLNTTDLHNGQGTRVTIGIPIELTQQKEPLHL